MDLSKDQKIDLRSRLIDLANGIGFSVELDSPMSDWLEETKKEHPEKFSEDGTMIQECRPAGSCNYLESRIQVREGKGLSGQVSTLIHELVHAMGMGGPSIYSIGGEGYVELVCESVTEFVTQQIGIERTHKTKPRVFGMYGYKGFLVSPVTQAYTQIFCDALNVPTPELKQEDHLFQFNLVHHGDDGEIVVNLL